MAEAVGESIDTVGRWQDWCNPGYNLKSAQDWIEYCLRSWFTGDEYELAIVDAASDAYLGGIGINQRNREHRFANLGYWVRQSSQGQGIARAAGRLAAEYAFATVGVTRLEIVVATTNVPSRKTAQAIGGQLEGIARNRLVLRGEAVDAAMYSMIPADVLGKPGAR